MISGVAAHRVGDGRASLLEDPPLGGWNRGRPHDLFGPALVRLKPCSGPAGAKDQPSLGGQVICPSVGQWGLWADDHEADLFLVAPAIEPEHGRLGNRFRAGGAHRTEACIGTGVDPKAAQP